MNKPNHSNGHNVSQYGKCSRRQLLDYKLALRGRLIVFQEMVRPAAKKIPISGEDKTA
jgi:hypothetical protein